MVYKLFFSKRSEKELDKLDSHISKLIVKWLKNNIDGCSNPRLHGKALVGSRAGQWRYRIGDYRVICEIRDNQLIVLAISIGHRRNVYEN